MGKVRALGSAADHASAPGPAGRTPAATARVNGPGVAPAPLPRALERRGAAVLRLVTVALIAVLGIFVIAV
jgi:hypothetical protein